MDLDERRLYEGANADALKAAMELKMMLARNELNVVTIESLTSGMIAKMITDIPGGGSALYGGFVVYDTDAKRMYANVTTKGVYSEKTAEQMARGALINSRAMVGLAVTGHAMPFRDEIKHVGEVDIGVAVRTSPKIVVETMHINFCDAPAARGFCQAWQRLHEENKYPPFQMTAQMADYIRLKTVSEACRFAVAVVGRHMSEIGGSKVSRKAWDATCRLSGPIRKHHEAVDATSETDCDSHSVDDIAGMTKYGGSRRRSSKKKGAASRPLHLTRRR